jgi:hypothetical protein
MVLLAILIIIVALVIASKIETVLEERKKDE